ncbi:GNAT family N-acetyltransferase [Clostridium sp. HBUAS56010]|uniref:GNAT family N-acetyltransferase n=1 Tax=Clostridium sp. HBUAS56010 TaxID=2571127 RepID=UPI0011773F74|nr:GNAT family N-acetyltransferase [Clostridium sp. HBUAS56010]
MDNKKIIAETDRLTLRRYQEDDLQDLFEYLSNPRVVEFEPYTPKTMKETENSLKWRISTDEMIAVELKSINKMIGNVYLGKSDFNSLEIGFVFNEQYWKKGYAQESCEKLIELEFQKGIHRIYANCDPINQNSWGLLERMGFVREGHLKKNVYFRKDKDGQPIWKDTFIYGRLNEKENINS